MQLMPEVLHDLLETGIIEEGHISVVFCSLIAKPSGAAWSIMDLSPWTDFYAKFPMRLYSVSEILQILPASLSKQSKFAFTHSFTFP
jgi:hypothetical protein